MPIYEYRCPVHGVFERYVRRIDPLLKRAYTVDQCPYCGALCRRVVSAPARTPGRWGDSTAYDDPVLGHVKNSMDRKRKMEARGLVDMADVRSRAERNILRQRDEYERGKRLDAAVKREEARTGGPVDGSTLLKIEREVK